MGNTQGKTAKGSKLEQAQRLLDDALNYSKKGDYARALDTLEGGLGPMRAYLTNSDSVETVKPLLIQSLMHKGWIMETTRRMDDAEACYREASELGDPGAKGKLETFVRKRQFAAGPRARLQNIAGAAATQSTGNVAQFQTGNVPSLGVASSTGSLGRSVNIGSARAANPSPTLPPKNSAALMANTSATSLSLSSSSLSSSSSSTSSTSLAVAKPNIFTANPVAVKAKPVNLAKGTVAENTEQLAQLIIQDKSKSSEDYQPRCALALDVINVFTASASKSRRLVTEVKALAGIDEADITTSLLEAFIYPIKNGVLLHASLVDGLAEVINHTNPKSLDPDDLVQVLNVLAARMSSMHIQNDAEKLEHMLASLSNLLNAMVDANVIDLNRTQIREPLQEFLDKYKDHSNKRLAYLANYSFQALLRVPNDESKLKSVLRRALLTAKGVQNLASAVKDFDPFKLFEAFEQFHEAAKFINRKAPWYDELRYAELLLKNDQFLGFEYYVKNTKKSHPYNEELFCAGLHYLLQEIIAKHKDLAIREACLHFLTSLLEDSRVTKHEEVCAAIISTLVEFAQHHEPTLLKAARALLLRVSNLDKSSLREFYKEYVPDLSKLPARAKPNEVIFPTDLLVAARDHSLRSISQKMDSQKDTLGAVAKQLDDIQDVLINNNNNSEFALLQSVTAKLDLVRDLVLNDADIALELAMYIPVRGAYRIQDSTTFDLDARVEEFKREPQQVLLLIGDAGGGKTTFNRYLEKKMWEAYKPGDPIPLFVSLPNLHKPEGNMMNEALALRGFNETEIQYLQQNHQFFLILDSWDEMNKWINLYSLNRLKEWNSKILIACRTQTLGTVKDNYLKYFAPTQGEKVAYDLIKEMTVVPFSDEQINAYIGKYLQLHPSSIWPSVERYQEQIKSLPGMRDLIATPFLLMLAMDVMPRIVQKFSHLRGGERVRVLQSNLYDEFIAKWFEREETKLMNSGKLPPDGHDVKEDFWEFSQALGAKMFAEKVTQITYIAARPALGSLKKQVEPSPWEDFFKMTDPDVYRARKACPLRKLDQNRWGFLHATLVEYFATKQMLAETLGDNPEQEIAQEPVREPSPIRTPSPQRTASPRKQARLSARLHVVPGEVSHAFMDRTSDHAGSTSSTAGLGEQHHPTLTVPHQSHALPTFMSVSDSYPAASSAATSSGSVNPNLLFSAPQVTPPKSPRPAALTSHAAWLSADQSKHTSGQPAINVTSATSATSGQNASTENLNRYPVPRPPSPLSQTTTATPQSTYGELTLSPPNGNTYAPAPAAAAVTRSAPAFPAVPMAGPGRQPAMPVANRGPAAGIFPPVPTQQPAAQPPAVQPAATQPPGRQAPAVPARGPMARPLPSPSRN